MKLQIILIFIMLIIGLVAAGITTTKIVHVQAESPWENGFWQKKMSWKARWVKTWHPKKIYIAVWKKVWGPVETNEWVALPKPPPGWTPPH